MRSFLTISSESRLQLRLFSFLIKIVNKKDNVVANAEATRKFMKTQLCSELWAKINIVLTLFFNSEQNLYRQNFISKNIQPS